MDEPSHLNVPITAVANPDASTLYPPNPMAEASRKRCKEDMAEIIPTPVAASAMLDPEVYNAVLKRKLDADLAAVAMWRTTREISQQSSPDNRASQNPDGSIQVSEIHTGDVSVHQLSSSSWEPSPSDDDMEQGAEKIRIINISPEKVKMRKESNRDSARRSRSRKAAHVKELEEQVKMAEEKMKRITCTINFPQVISGIPSLGIPLSGSQLDGVFDTSLPSQNTSHRSFTLQQQMMMLKNNYFPNLAPPF